MENIKDQPSSFGNLACVLMQCKAALTFPSEARTAELIKLSGNLDQSFDNTPSIKAASFTESLLEIRLLMDATRRNLRVLRQVLGQDSVSFSELRMYQLPAGGW